MQQGFFIVERTCKTCGGTGEVIKNKCPTCKGSGRINKKRVLSVKIPAGVDNGNRIRLSGEGEAGMRGGRNGDLYVFVSVKQHAFFERSEANLNCEIPIKITTAALGGSVEVPLIEGGKATVKIPEGTQTGSKLRLKGKGMVVMNSGGRRGDMFVTVNIETPTNLTSEEKKLFKQLDENLSKKENSKVNSFFKKWFG
jgi:molecular chaperone DnaJ